jgi:nitric oxide reductase large subunit
MKSGFTKIAIIVLSILLAVCVFEILNIESYYEDQRFVNAPSDDLKSIRTDQYLIIATSILFLLALVYFIYLHYKKVN